MEYFIPIKDHKIKFYFALCSGIIYQLGSSLVITIGNFCVYFASYIHYKDNWVNMQYGNIMAPIILLLLSSFSPISGVIEKKIGPKLTLLLSSVIVEICFILYYYQRNLWIFYTISVIIGIGNGISAGVPIKNACLYYPKKKGIINSSIVCLGGLVSSLYVTIGEKIINPDKVTIKDKKTNPFYPEEIANKSKKFFIFAMIVLPITTLLSLFLFYKFEKPKDKENENENINESKNEKMLKQQKEKETNTKEILLNIRFWRNMIIISLMPFWIYFLNATYRAYSPMLGVNSNLIPRLPTIITALSSITGMIWALIFDKFGFQIITKIMSLSCIFLSIYFTIFIDNKTLYVIGLILSTVISRVGMMSIINPHIMQVYEFRNYLIIGGFARLFNQLSFFIAGLTSIFLSFKYKTGDELKTPYAIIASIGIILSYTGFILSLFENDEKYIFKNNERYRKQSLGINNQEIEIISNEEENVNIKSKNV